MGMNGESNWWKMNTMNMNMNPTPRAKISSVSREFVWKMCDPEILFANSQLFHSNTSWSMFLLLPALDQSNIVKVKQQPFVTVAMLMGS